MCGIAGIINQDGSPVDPALLKRMVGRLAFRGPDEEGIFVDGPVGLGHRRLSVIDLETGGQPMGNEDGRVQVICNGEIYNFRELRSELESRGHRFKTRSDTEVIVHLYEEMGSRCVGKLNGMFAFALWDAREQRLLLARDRLGQKPLYYAQTKKALLFASMPAPLFLHPGVDPEIDPVAVDLYLSLMYIPGPLSIYKSIQKLDPAHLLERTPDRRVKKTRYWHLSYTPKHNLGVEDAAEQLGEHLEEAVRARLVSDVPLGAFLSGGIDSSLVVALMAAGRGRSFKTFSVGNLSPFHDEVPYARWMSRMFGTEHNVCFFQPAEVEDSGDVLRDCPEPLSDPSLIPLHRLSKRAREEVTVVLSGDAGDENFAGYDRYLYAGLSRIFPKKIPDSSGLAGDTLRGLLSRGTDKTPYGNRWSKLMRFLTLPLEHGHLHQFDQLGGISRCDLYTRDMFHSLPNERPAEGYFSPLFSQLPDGLNWLDRLLSVDVDSYLAWNILPKVDTATMAHALECRSPFLDHRFMEFVACLPSSYKLRRLTRKYILKKYGEKWLPKEIVYRRKTGFGIPLSDWLRGEMGERAVDLLCSQGACTSGLFEASAVRRLLEEHRSRRADRSYLLWSLFQLEQWLQVHPFRLPV